MSSAAQEMNLVNMKPVDTIKINCMYINIDGEIIKTTASQLKVTDSVIRKNEFLRIVHANTLSEHMSKYLFHSMMLYHIHHTHDDLEGMADDPDDAKETFTDCLYEINMHRDLVLPEAMEVFGDVHEIFILYRERKSCRLEGGTTGKSRRVRIQVPRGGHTRRSLL